MAFESIISGELARQAQGSRDIQNIFAQFAGGIEQGRQQRAQQEAGMQIAEQEIAAMSKIDPKIAEQFMSVAETGKPQDIINFANAAKAGLALTQQQEQLDLSNKLANLDIQAKEQDVKTGGIDVATKQRSFEDFQKFDRDLASAVETFSAGSNVDEATRQQAQSFLSSFSDEDQNAIMTAASQGVPTSQIYQMTIDRAKAAGDPATKVKNLTAQYKLAREKVGLAADEAGLKKTEADIRKIDADIAKLNAAGGSDPKLRSTIRGQFNSLKPIKDLGDVQAAGNKVKSVADKASKLAVKMGILKQGEPLTIEAFEQVDSKDPNAVTAADDLALIFNFMKMLDPGSVVREGEFANAQNAAGVPDRIANLYNRLVDGERLNPRQRFEFIQTSQSALQGQIDSAKPFIQTYLDEETRTGSPKGSIVPEAFARLLTEEAPAQQAPSDPFPAGQEVEFQGMRGRVSDDGQYFITPEGRRKINR